MRKIKRIILQFSEIIFIYVPTFLAHLKEHYEFYKTLAFFKKNNLIGFRTYQVYLFSYLSKGLSIVDKLVILTHHYSFIKKSFSENSLRAIFLTDLVCWEEQSAEGCFRILLKANHLESEGSLTLFFKVNDKLVFNLNFSFVPGNVFGLKNTETILLISCLKGFENEIVNITRISEFFYDMSPRVILMKVAECIAVSFKLDTILAVSTAKHVSFGNKKFDEVFYNNYDNFWKKIRGVKLDNGYYYFECPTSYKPIDLIKGKYRKRTINRREKLNEIFNNSSVLFAKHLAKNASIVLIFLYDIVLY